MAGTALKAKLILKNCFLGPNTGVYGIKSDKYQIIDDEHFRQSIKLVLSQ